MAYGGFGGWQFGGPIAAAATRWRFPPGAEGAPDPREFMTGGGFGHYGMLGGDPMAPQQPPPGLGAAPGLDQGARNALMRYQAGGGGPVGPPQGIPPGLAAGARGLGGPGFMPGNDTPNLDPAMMERVSQILQRARSGDVDGARNMVEILRGGGFQHPGAMVGGGVQAPSGAPGSPGAGGGIENGIYAVRGLPVAPGLQHPGIQQKSAAPMPMPAAQAPPASGSYARGDDGGVPTQPVAGPEPITGGGLMHSGQPALPERLQRRIADGRMTEATARNRFAAGQAGQLPGQRPIAPPMPTTGGGAQAPRPRPASGGVASGAAGPARAAAPKPAAQPRKPAAEVGGTPGGVAEKRRKKPAVNQGRTGLGRAYG